MSYKFIPLSILSLKLARLLKSYKHKSKSVSERKKTNKLCFNKELKTL